MRYFPLFLFILTACLLCIDTANGLSFHLITAPVLTAFLISWPMGFLPRQIRRVVQFAIGEFVIAICMVDCYCQEFFATSITPQILSNVFLSDTREAFEFFINFIGLQILYRWRIVVLLILGIGLPFALFFLTNPLTIKKTYNYISGGLLGLCIIYEIPTTYNYLQLFFQKHDLQNIEGLIFRHYHEEVQTPLHRFVFAHYALKQSSYVLDAIKHSTLAAKIDNSSYQSPHIVLIIGESYNKHHSSLYGYKLPTAPLQQQRIKEGELFPFTNAVTPWNITSNVFLNIFSLWEYGYKNHITDYPLFPILFKRAGYSIGFFSNQYIFKGIFKGTTNQAGHFFLADSELSDSLFSFRNETSSKYDMGIVRQLESYKKDSICKNYTLDIVHLIGQHFEYSLRYPGSQATFTRKDYEDRQLEEDANNIVMHYDNATRYNDAVLDSILSLYEKENAVAVFISDHGEEVYDELPIHGRLFQTPTAIQAKNEFEVPMWIWCSRKYIENHAEIVADIRNSMAKPFMTDGLPQILLYLAGIKCKWTDNHRNLLSPLYKEKPRIICGNIDYDILTK